MEQRTDVIVVGGGLAGLIAAAEAARAGAAVELCEASDVLGGRARTRPVAGFAFNQGPHALYREGALRHALDRLGVAFTGRAPRFAQALAVSGEAINLLPFTPGAMARTALLAPAERRTLAGCFRAFVGQNVPQSGESVSLYFDRLGVTPTVRRVLEALVRVTTYCHAPDHLDAKAAIGQIVLGFKGVVYVDGGWGQLVETLAGRVQSLSVRLRTGSGVERVEPSHDGVTVHFADGSRRSVGAVVLAVAPADAARLAPTTGELARAAELARPVRSLCLDLGLTSLPARRRTYALGLTRPLYFSVHSAAARLAPPGAAMIHVARFLGDGEPVGRADFAELEGFADLVQPGWRAVEAARQRLVGIVVANDYPQAARGGLAGRAPGSLADHGRVFIAGDWVGSEGFLSDAAAASGAWAGAAASARARHDATRARPALRA